MPANIATDRIKAALYSLAQDIRYGRGGQGSTELYHTLIYGTMSNIIQSCYLRLFQSVTSDMQEILLKTFLAKHPCSRPEHHQLPTEFLKFLQSTSLPILLKKIAECEWLELATEIHPLPEFIEPESRASLLDHAFIVSPTVTLVTLPFDFDALSASCIPLAEQCSYYRLIYSDKKKRVNNIAIQPFMARLMQLLQQHAAQRTAHEMAAIFIEECQAVIDEHTILEAIVWLYRRDILLIKPSEGEYQ